MVRPAPALFDPALYDCVGRYEYPDGGRGTVIAMPGLREPLFDDPLPFGVDIDGAELCAGADCTGAALCGVEYCGVAFVCPG